jgi:hypothetical protein
MKMIHCLFLLGGLMFLLLPCSTHAEQNGLVTRDRVNVRGQASVASGEVITQLRKGERVTVLEEISIPNPKEGEPAKWFRIGLPANTPVWVHSDFVDPSAKTITATRLNVRAGPGENFSVVARLEKGTPVKEIRTVNKWMEIEPPENAHAFVAADFISKGTEAASAQPVPPAAEPAAEPPTVAPVPADPILPPAAEVTTFPPAVEPIESIEPEPAEAAPAKRLVKREGVVRRDFSLATPSYYALENPGTGRTINYLHNTRPEYKLKHYVGFKVIVSGEEALDRRWPNTPVLRVETIDLP